MSTPPRIAIPVPTSFDPAYNAKSWPEYALAVTRSGGEAVRVELGAELSDILPNLDGVLLPGSGADVDPSRYGHERLPECAQADPLREKLDEELLHFAESSQAPLLAICFGMQSLNVHRGGTLVQHLPPLPVNHPAGRAVFEAHGALLAEGSRMANFASEVRAESGTPEGRLMVNSSHHQAVGAVGDDLRITARSSEDGVIEAIEDTNGAWIVGVQWHPERTFDHSPVSRALFADFVQVAQTRAAARNSPS